MNRKRLLAVIVSLFVSFALFASASAEEMKKEGTVEKPAVVKKAPKEKPPVAKKEGDSYIDFTLPDADGKEIALSSVLGKKATLLLFVQSACGTCRAEVSDISKALEERDDISAVFVVVDVAGPKFAKKTFVDIYELEKHGTVLYDPEFKSGRSYFVFATPATIVIKDGKVLKRFDGYNPNEKDALEFVKGM